MDELLRLTSPELDKVVLTGKMYREPSVSGPLVLGRGEFTLGVVQLTGEQLELVDAVDSLKAVLGASFSQCTLLRFLYSRMESFRLTGAETFVGVEGAASTEAGSEDTESRFLLKLLNGRSSLSRSPSVVRGSDELRAEVDS